MRLPTLKTLLPAMLFMAPIAAAQQLPLQHYGQQEGLGNLSVNRLARDKQGYLWAATENGLFRFNGGEFLRYAAAEGLAEQIVTTVYSDRTGTLWAGTYDNLYRMRDGRLVPVTAEGKPLPVRPDQVMAETAAGELLAVSLARLFVVGGKAGDDRARPYFSAVQLEKQPELQSIRAIYADTDGSLWMACRDGLCRAADGRVTVYGAAQGLPAGPWTSILRDSGGALWVRSARHVYTLPPHGERFEDRTPPGDPFRKIQVRTELHADTAGRILTNGDPGLLCWDHGRWQEFGRRNGLNAGGGVADILTDPNQGAWLATRGRGLVHWLGYGNWQNWTSAQGLTDDVIISMLRDRDGRLHIGTRSGHALQAADGSRFDTVPTPPDLSGHQWASMALDRQGRIWAGTYSGLLLRYLPATGKTELIGRLPLVTQVMPQADGRIWIATRKGLYVAQESAPAGSGAQPVALPAVAGRDSETRVTRGCQDRDGHLWIASNRDVLHYDGARWQVLPFARHTREAEFETVACAPDGSLWAGSTSALWRLQVRGTLSASRVDAAVLRGRSVQMLTVDSRGWLWVGSDAGFAVWNGARWRMVNQSLGLAWNDINGRGFYEDRDGSIWIATSNGLSHLLHPERLFVEAAPRAVLDEVQRGGRKVRLDAGPLGWSEDALIFRLASLAYEDRQDLQYRYRLAGSEQQWSVSSSPEVRYAALPGGTYRFQYQAINGATGERSPLAEAAFTIAPPWWRSYPFYALCGAAVLAGFWGLHRYRLRKMTLRQIELAILVQQRTRELEQSQEELRMRALKDGLTKAWNRSAMMELLTREIEKCQRTHESFVLVLLDLDFFKRINDTHGHLAGDAVLVEVARRLALTIRPYDAVGRYGGEEFMVLMPGLALPDGAHRIEALRHEVRTTPVDIGSGQFLTVTASFGAAAFTPAHQAPAMELLRAADEALYAAKHAGRDRIHYADADSTADVMA